MQTGGNRIFTKTGGGDDVFLYDPEFPIDKIKTIWRDTGGEDAVGLDHYQIAALSRYFSIKDTGKAIKITIGPESLAIKHDANSEPSVEFLQWRETIDHREKLGELKFQVRIVTDPAEFTGAGQIFIGNDTGQTIRTSAPSNGTTPIDIYAAGGNDTIILESALMTRARGGDDDDVIRAIGAADTQQWGDDGDDNLFGGAGDDTLTGGRGRDLLKGGDGDDLLVGDDHLDAWVFPGDRDRLFGGDGDDHIHGGLGRDVMHGGAGRDLFSWDIAQIGVKDVIRDFNADEDRLLLDLHQVIGTLKARHKDGHTFISYGGRDVVRLDDVTLTLSEIDISLF